MNIIGNLYILSLSIIGNCEEDLTEKILSEVVIVFLNKQNMSINVVTDISVSHCL